MKKEAEESKHMDLQKLQPQQFQKLCYSHLGQPNPSQQKRKGCFPVVATNMIVFVQACAKT